MYVLPGRDRQQSCELTGTKLMSGPDHDMPPLFTITTRFSRAFRSGWAAIDNVPRRTFATWNHGEHKHEDEPQSAKELSSGSIAPRSSHQKWDWLRSLTDATWSLPSPRDYLAEPAADRCRPHLPWAGVSEWRTLCKWLRWFVPCSKNRRRALSGTGTLLHAENASGL